MDRRRNMNVVWRLKMVQWFSSKSGPLLYVFCPLFCMKLGHSAKNLFGKMNQIFCTKSPIILEWKSMRGAKMPTSKEILYSTEKTGRRQRKKREEKSGMTAGRYLYNIYVFCIFQHLILRECKRFYMRSEPMVLD